MKRVVGIILLVLTILMLRSVLSGPPGDARLVRQFQNDRPLLEELKTMLATNSPGEPTRPDMGVTSMEDYHHYESLLRQTRVIHAIRIGEDYRFQIAGKPNTKTGLRIDFVWTEATPDRLISKLGDFRKLSGAPDHAYRPLDKNWYLWIQK